MPQPNFVPVMPNTSRNTQSSGMSSGASKLCCSPLIFSVGMRSSRSREVRRSAVVPFWSLGRAEQVRIDLAVQAPFKFLGKFEHDWKRSMVEVDALYETGCVARDDSRSADGLAKHAALPLQERFTAVDRFRCEAETIVQATGRCREKRIDGGSADERAI